MFFVAVIALCIIFAISKQVRKIHKRTCKMHSWEQFEGQWLCSVCYSRPSQ